MATNSELRERVAQLESENLELRRKLKEPLPLREDFGDKYIEAILKCMMSRNLTGPQLKEAFCDLVSEYDDDWSWIPEKLFATPNGDLWRITYGVLQVNITKLRSVDPDWVDVDELYKNEWIPTVGHYFKNQSRSTTK